MRKRVLIVDDERPIGYMLSKQLEQWGYRCATALSGQEALALLPKSEFDLMLLDARMPGISGLEVLKQSKRDFASMPVVMLSAAIDLKIVADAVALGADDYITKPCNPDDLKSKIQQVMEGRELANQITNGFNAATTTGTPVSSVKSNS